MNSTNQWQFEWFSGEKNETGTLLRFFGLSIAFHVILFVGAMFMPEIHLPQSYKPSVINVSMVTLPGPPAPAGGGPIEPAPPEPKPPEPQPEPVKEPEPIAPVPETPPEPVVQAPEPIVEAPEPPPEAISIAPKEKKTFKPKKSLKKKTYEPKKIVKKTEPKKPPKKVPKKTPKVDDSKKVANAIDQIRAKVAKTEGTRKSGTGTSKSGGGTGAASGTGGSGLGAQALRAIDIYRAVVASAIESNWAFSQQLAGGAQDLESIIVVKIKASGDIADTWFEKKSGNRYLDESVYRAVQKSTPLPPLPSDYPRRTYTLGLKFTPTGIR
jgi:colicin import membrane protein